MSQLIILAEIEPFSLPTPGDYYPETARCDFCCRGVGDDFMNGATEPRPYYELIGDGLTVCIDCVRDIEDSTMS